MMDHKRHGWLMLLGCGLMLAGAAYLFSGGLGGIAGPAGEAPAAAAANSAGGAGSWAWLLILACPLLHLFMMRGHGHGEHHGPARQQEAGSNPAQAEQSK